MAGFCRSCGVDDQPLGVAVDFGALCEQAGGGDAEIKKGGLDWTGPSRRPSVIVRVRNTPWSRPRNLKAISVPGNSRPREGEGPAWRLDDLGDRTDRLRSSATGLPGLCVAGEQFFHSLLRGPGERVGDVVLGGKRAGGHEDAPCLRDGADLIVFCMGESSRVWHA